MIRLKNALLLNAVSSGATGLLLLIFPGFFAGLFGTSQSIPYTVTGIFLLFFALDVYLQSRKDPLHYGRVQWIIALDILWVVGSLIIIVPRLFNLTAIGYILIGGVALWVAAMAVLQSLGLRQLSGKSTAGPSSIS